MPIDIQTAAPAPDARSAWIDPVCVEVNVAEVTEATAQPGQDGNNLS